MSKTKKFKRGVRLNKIPDVRRLLARLINQHLAGDISTDSLRAITYSCNTIIQTLEKADLESRLDALEEKVSELTKN
jgi:hypothetical protein